LLVEEGDRVTSGNPVAILESMKMEFAVEVHVSGTVREVFCRKGGHISAGQMLLVVQEDKD
jgi:urea carboxylase